MKKHLALIAFIMAAAVVTAQEKGRGDHRRDVADQMKTELSLSDNQYERIKSIDESYKARFHDLRMDSAKSKDDKMKSMRTLGEARRKEFESVLTNEQKTKWQEQQNARREEHRAHGQKVANDRAEKIRKDLSLSDKQYEKFQKANAEFHQKAMELKKKELGNDARKAEFGRLSKDYDKSIKSILNKDQYKKWSDMKRAHHGNNGRHMRSEPKGS
ncbi:MAG: hypothetical protein QM762_16905 [Chryseolinea sp.]